MFADNLSPSDAEACLDTIATSSALSIYTGLTPECLSKQNYIRHCIGTPEQEIHLPWKNNSSNTEMLINIQMPLLPFGENVHKNSNHLQMMVF